MTTEQYAIGYEAGYQDGWNAALEANHEVTSAKAEQPAEQANVRDAAPEAVQSTKDESLTDEEIRHIIRSEPQPATPIALGSWAVNVCHVAISAYKRKNGIGEKK